MGRRRRMVAAACYGVVVGGAAVLCAWALPPMLRFVPDDPIGFAVLVAIALLVDVPFYRVGRPVPTRVATSLSTTAALAIFVEWGLAPAIITQAVAATFSVVWRGYDRSAGIAFVARHIGAVAVAGFVTLAVGLPADIGQHVTGVARTILLPYALMALVWLAASFVLLLLARAPVTGYGLRSNATVAADDILMVAGSIPLAVPLLSTETGWWSFVPALPMFTWTVLARVRLAKERNLSREPVSGLLDRVGIDARVQEFTLYDYVQPEQPERFGVVLINVDTLLTINRLFGRDAYDEVARKLARRLVDAYGERQAGRLAGEGAVVIVPGMAAESALADGEAAAAVLAAPVDVRGVPFRLEPTAGVALSPQHGRDFGVLLAGADFALREARRRGLTAMVYGQRELENAGERLTTLLELEAALSQPARRGEVYVLYQPQIELSTGRLVGVEALVRWRHPEWGDVRPDQFIAVVESSAVMHTLTMRVLGMAARQVRQWNDSGFETRVSVNASVQDLHEPAFADEIAGVIQAHRIRPRQLTIEITERMVIGGDPQVARAAERIAQLGVGLSLDDFGVGFASLDQLRTLPLTEVKIDRSYVEEVATRPDDWAIVANLRALAEVLHLEMVAEGVEDEPTAACLARLPGVIGQGYYFGRPMTASALDQWRASMPSVSAAR